MTSVTFPSCVGRGSVDPDRAQMEAIARVLLPTPLLGEFGKKRGHEKNKEMVNYEQTVAYLSEPKSLFVPLSNTTPRFLNG